MRNDRRSIFNETDVQSVCEKEVRDAWSLIDKEEESEKSWSANMGSP